MSLRRGLASAAATAARVSWKRCAVSSVDVARVAGAVGVVTNAAGNLKQGDHVVSGPIGTVDVESSLDEKSLFVVPKDLPLDHAATLGQAGAALRILDEAGLSEGDLILQSGPMGAFAQAVVQIAAGRGLKTVTVLSEAQGFAQASADLKAKGADVVTATAYADSAEWRRLLADFPAAKLAINASGGVPATALARALAPGGALVTTEGGGRVSACCATYGAAGRRLADDLKKDGVPVILALRSAGDRETAKKSGWTEGDNLFTLEGARAAGFSLVPPEVAASIELKCANVDSPLDCALLDDVLALRLEPPTVDLKPFSCKTHAMRKAEMRAGTVVMVMDE